MNKLTKSRPFMNTLVEVTVRAGTKVDAMNAIEEAFAKFDYVVNRFSRFDPHSELSKLNKSGGEWFEVSGELMKLIMRSIATAAETQGKFDPTIVDMLSAYGYDVSYNPDRITGKIRDPKLKKEIETLAKTRPSFKDIQIDKANSTIKLAPYQKIDLGASGKGYAIDLAYEAMKKYDVSEFLINAGGDMRAAGSWKAALFNPLAPDQFAGTIEIKDQALAGSGSYARRVGEFHHVIDPKTGKASNQVLQTYIVAPTAIEADIYSTVSFLLGHDSRKLIESKGYKLMIIDENGIHGRLD